MKYATYSKYKPSNIGWIRDFPAHWELKRLKYVANRAELKVEADEDNPLPYIGLEQVEPWTGRLIELDDDLVPTGVSNRFAAGDTLFGKLRPYLAKACNVDFDGLCSSELLVLRGKTYDRKFLLYQLLSHGFINLVDSSTYGSKMPRANWDFIGICELPLPPVDEQQTIARFLDAKTAQIDALVAQKRQLIEKLKEKRQALIARTVTRGLPPEAAKAAGREPNPEMKDSGVGWLGQLPKHWHVLPMTKYLSDMSDYRGKTPEKTDDGVFLVTARNVRMGYIDYESSQEYVAAEDYDEIMRRGLPKIGDILFTTEAPLGNVALVDREDIALAQRIIRFRMRRDFFHSRFTLYAMLADYFQSQLKSLSTGSTAEGLKASKLSVLRLIAPPVAEQQAIAAFLDAECGHMDRLLETTGMAIERLIEYRQSLITSAVTGKIDVRELA
jgi:type I restriction enzyme S subunit